MRSSLNREQYGLALYYVCYFGATEICELLICFGADVNFLANYPATHPIHLLILSFIPPLLYSLFHRSLGHVSPLFIACYNAHPVCVDFLLASGANANLANVGDFSPLIATAFLKGGKQFGFTLDQFIDNRCRCMRSLLGAGAAIDNTTHTGHTALNTSVWNRRLTEILIESRANVNHLTICLNSCLHRAVRLRSADVVKMLCESISHTDDVNVCGWSALMYACNAVNPAIVELLIDYGANIDLVHSGGCTALKIVMLKPSISRYRVAVLQLLAGSVEKRVMESSADWIRLARIERNQHQDWVSSKKCWYV